MRPYQTYSFDFFNDTATTEIYPLSLHDALPIWILSSPPAALSKSSRQTHPRASAAELRPRFAASIGGSSPSSFSPSLQLWFGARSPFTRNLRSDRLPMP